MILPRAKTLSILVLLFLTISAGLIRGQNHLKSQRFSIDERVYATLAMQAVKNPFDYNTLDLADILEKEDPSLAPLPDYFRQPLFKHPPLFPWLLALGLKFFGTHSVVAIAVPAFFGSLLILMGYLFGRLFSNERVGLLAAFALWLDPVNIICSQKIWMETTLSFWTLLSLYLFTYGLKKTKDHFFILSGLASGLATLTKYPGFLGTVIIGLYALLLAPDLFRNKNFQRGMILPVVMLIPWLLWNVQVFGFDHFFTLGTLHGAPPRIALFLVLIGAVAFIRVVLFKKASPATDLNPAEDENPATPDHTHPANTFRRGLLAVYGLAFFLALSPQIIAAFSWDRLPLVSWQCCLFQHPLFYFGRLVEFFGLYLFAFIPFFLPREERTTEELLLPFSLVVLFVFSLLWGNYQSRYILATTPLLLVMAVQFVAHLYTRLANTPCPWLRRLGQAGLTSLLIYFFLKTNYINMLVSFPNDMCYF